MSLDAKQTELFETLFGKRHSEIMAKAATDFHNADYVEPNQAPRLYATIAEQFAKDIAEAKIDGYIETVEKLNIVPEKADFYPLGLEIKELALKAVNTFNLKMKQPVINQDKEWQSRMLSVLTAKIEAVVGHAVPRLKYFIDERSLLDEIKPPVADVPSKWSLDQKLSLTQVILSVVAILITVLVFILGLATAEGRAFVCKHSGYLCDQTTPESKPDNSVPQ